MTHERFITIAKALADPMRLKILNEIREARELTCSCVCDRLPLSQPTVSHHVRALEKAGLIRIRKDGQFHRLTVNQKTLDHFGAHLTGTAGVRTRTRPRT